MKVRIDAGGREVEIECSDSNVTADQIGDKALQLWKETESARGTGGPGYGFSMERRADRPPSTAARRPGGVIE